MGQRCNGFKYGIDWGISNSNAQKQQAHEWSMSTSTIITEKNNNNKKGAEKERKRLDFSGNGQYLIKPPPQTYPAARTGLVGTGNEFRVAIRL